MSLEGLTQTRVWKIVRQDELGLLPDLIYAFGEYHLCNRNSKTMCFLDELIRQASGNPFGKLILDWVAGVTESLRRLIT